MGREVCIVIPIYKLQFDKKEEKTISHNIKALHDCICCFVAPQSLNTVYYEKKYPNINVIFFKSKFFKSIKGYNKLMLSTMFYKRFLNYKYILICQADAIILKNSTALQEFIDMDYDYIGAPWVPEVKFYQYLPKNKKEEWFAEHFLKEYKAKVGNGGLSLRNVRSTILLLRRLFLLRFLWSNSEDLFFAQAGEHAEVKYKIAPCEVAKEFALEQEAKRIIRKEKKKPFGIHAYELYYPDIWELEMRDGNENSVLF